MNRLWWLALGLTLFMTMTRAENALQVAEIPSAAGSFEQDDICREHSGRYEILGDCIQGECQPSERSFRNVIGAKYPPPSMKFSKEDRRYVDFSYDGLRTLNARIVIGDYITDWKSQDFACENGWLRLSRRSEGSAEGSSTKVDIATYFRRNDTGDLVALRAVSGRTSILFGLLWADIDEKNWIIFRRTAK